MNIEIIQSEHFNLLTTFFVENNLPAITNTFNPFPLTEITARWIAYEPHKDMFFLALQSQKPVGFSMLRGWEEGYKIPSFGMFVDYRQHGKGYGKDLLRLTVEAAQKHNCTQVRLSVYASNLPACKIYSSYGFFETERTDIEHHEKRDQKIIMVKDLS